MSIITLNPVIGFASWLFFLRKPTDLAASWDNFI